MCVEKPDLYTQKMMFRLMSDVGQIVEELYNAVILQEECDGKIMEEAIPNPEFFKKAYPNLKPYMVMYMTDSILLTNWFLILTANGQQA